MSPPAAIDTRVQAVTDTQGVTLPTPTSLPLKINERYLRCSTTDHAKKSQWGVAAPATSALFKIPTAGAKSKPKARRWDRLMTEETLSRKPSTLKTAARFLSKPGLISLGGGLPTPAYFPFSQLSAIVPTPPGFSEEETTVSSTSLIANKYDLTHGQSIFDVATAFNYGQGTGSAQLLRWVTEHTELVHNPPYADWACNLTIGSTSAIDMSLRMFAKRGDYILTEEYTFPTAVETAGPMGLNIVGVRMDEQGMLPDVLDDILSNWTEAACNGAKKPRVLYTVPTGQNPTGATMGHDRRRRLYEVCQKHDVYILEDEPYYFLQMPDYDPAAEADAAHQTDEEFLSALIPSFLSMDVDGRVLRMDSFSKVICPGSRIGWITASEQIIERYKMHVDCSTQGPSGFSQLMLFKLLDEHWRHSGYLGWLKYIRSEYTQRRDVIVAACEKHLPRDIVSWVPPKAGMFHWMEVDWKQHPLAETWSLAEIEEQIFMATVEQGALVTCGSWFFADSEIAQDKMFFRATFAAAPSDTIDAAIKRFGDGVREVFGLSNNLSRLQEA